MLGNEGCLIGDFLGKHNIHFLERVQGEEILKTYKPVFLGCKPNVSCSITDSICDGLGNKPKLFWILGIGPGVR